MDSSLCRNQTDREWEREKRSERIYSSKPTLDSFKMSRAILNFACAYTAEEKTHWVNKGKRDWGLGWENVCVPLWLWVEKWELESEHRVNWERGKTGLGRGELQKISSPDGLLDMAQPRSRGSVCLWCMYTVVCVLAGLSVQHEWLKSLPLNIPVAVYQLTLSVSLWSFANDYLAI